MAVVSLICSLLWLGGAGSILAVVFGEVAYKQFKAPGNQESGRGMASAGRVLGWLGIVGLVLILVAAAAGA